MLIAHSATRQKHSSMMTHDSLQWVRFHAGSPANRKARTAHFQWMPSSSSVLKSWAQKTVVFKSSNLGFRHNTTQCSAGACNLSSYNTCSARNGGPNGTEMGQKKTTTQPWLEHADGGTLVTPTQAGGDTTTWSVCTCWPEAVTTGASVCSCTAVTVPCACR